MPSSRSPIARDGELMELGQFLAAPAATPLAEVERRATQAADDVSVEGHLVRYERSIYAAEDEICFHLFDADSIDSVQLAADRAELKPQCIVEAIESSVADRS